MILFYRGVFLPAVSERTLGIPLSRRYWVIDTFGFEIFGRKPTSAKASAMSAMDSASGQKLTFTSKGELNDFLNGDVAKDGRQEQGLRR